MFMCTRTALMLMLLVEAGLFYAASLLHAGVVLGGYMHLRAATAEAVIGTILAVGVVFCIVRPGQTPQVALWTQGIGLVGTLVGAFTIAIGIGPQTLADQIFHAFLLTVLTVGIVLAWEIWHRPP
ncbi:hypothetical protein EV681_1278 [Advenella incenata]|uniref:Uncharacterized protein n=1 Tax=Advenella incenata TaxID=267800 RepID=A0A4Q7VSM9_9BURK|nr:hypothetical protein [Advenella incenata]RZT99492.1 hypothetical protein EV681_1278 [Advenella incenata]